MDTATLTAPDTATAADPYTDAARCEWCRAHVYADEGLVTDDDGNPRHVKCAIQETDEQELRTFLGQIARDCAEKIAEYASLHPTRVREHHARGLLGRIETVIAAAVR